MKALKLEQECFAIIKEVNETQLGNNLLLEIEMLVFLVLLPMHLDLVMRKRTELLESLFTKYLPRYNELISDFKNSALYPFLTVWPRLFGTVRDIKDELNQIILPAGATTHFRQSRRYG